MKISLVLSRGSCWMVSSIMQVSLHQCRYQSQGTPLYNRAVSKSMLHEIIYDSAKWSQAKEY